MVDDSGWRQNLFKMLPTSQDNWFMWAAWSDQQPVGFLVRPHSHAEFVLIVCRADPISVKIIRRHDRAACYSSAHNETSQRGAPLAVIDGELCSCCDVLTCDDEHVWPSPVLHVQPARVPARDAFVPGRRSVGAEYLRDA